MESRTRPPWFASSTPSCTAGSTELPSKFPAQIRSGQFYGTDGLGGKGRTRIMRRMRPKLHLPVLGRASEAPSHWSHGIIRHLGGCCCVTSIYSRVARFIPVDTLEQTRKAPARRPWGPYSRSRPNRETAPDSLFPDSGRIGNRGPPAAGNPPQNGKRGIRFPIPE